MGGFEIIPVDGALGAEIHCESVADVDDAEFTKIYRAWLDHLVLLFPRQHVSHTDFIRFGARFGNIRTTDLVSNVIENGIPIGLLGNSDVVWHSDMTTFLQPPAGTALYSVELPPNGGDTFFMNMYAAYDSLSAELKNELIPLQIKHGAVHDSSGCGTGAVHPVVYTHPETGCNALYLGARENTRIEGVSVSESDRLLDVLWRHVIQWRFIWRHQWCVGDIMVWDNRCTLHARQRFDADSRRMLYRLEIQGPGHPRTAEDALRRLPHYRLR
jgi:taurine dioxygenase